MTEPASGGGPFDERVARGAAVLDEAVPGWDAHIDLAYLDMRHPSDCVLGQTFDNATFGMTMLGLDDGAPYGFELNANEGDEAWRALDDAWRSLILNRRAPG